MLIKYIIDTSFQKNTGRGDFLRVAFDKINKNFFELFFYLGRIANKARVLEIEKNLHLYPKQEDDQETDDLYLTESSKRVYTLIALKDDLIVYLPKVQDYLPGGPSFYIRNQGYYDFVVRTYDNKFVAKVTKNNSIMLFKKGYYSDTGYFELEEEVPMVEPVEPPIYSGPPKPLIIKNLYTSPTPRSGWPVSYNYSFYFDPEFGGGEVNFVGTKIFGNNMGNGPQGLHNGMHEEYFFASSWIPEGSPKYGRWTFPKKVSLSKIYVMLGATMPGGYGGSYFGLPSSIIVKANYKNNQTLETVLTATPTTLTSSSGHSSSKYSGVFYTGPGYSIDVPTDISANTWELEFIVTSPNTTTYIGEIEFWGVPNE